MPLFSTQLHRCLGGQICCNATFFRSGVRPLCTTVTAASRHFNHRLTATKSDSNGSSSSGQGFGKPPTNQQKKQKPEVSSTTDALLRSLGGKSGMSWFCFLELEAAEALQVFWLADSVIARSSNNRQVALQRSQALRGEMQDLPTWFLGQTTLRRNGGS